MYFSLPPHPRTASAEQRKDKDIFRGEGTQHFVGTGLKSFTNWKQRVEVIGSNPESAHWGRSKHINLTRIHPGLGNSISIQNLTNQLVSIKSNQNQQQWKLSFPFSLATYIPNLWHINGMSCWSRTIKLLVLGALAFMIDYILRGGASPELGTKICHWASFFYWPLSIFFYWPLSIWPKKANFLFLDKMEFGVFVGALASISTNFRAFGWTVSF